MSRFMNKIYEQDFSLVFMVLVKTVMVGGPSPGGEREKRGLNVQAQVLVRKRLYCTTYASGENKVNEAYKVQTRVE